MGNDITTKKPDENGDSAYVDTDVSERPLDPSRNASDLMGDPSGMTGWTVGSGPDTSAEPTEEQPSAENFPGGILEDEVSHQPTGIPKEAFSDTVYNHNAWKGMSQAKAAQSEDMAEEGEIFDSVSDMLQPTFEEDQKDTYDPYALRKESAGDDSPGSDDINTETAPYSSPENVGEQEVSGSESDPNSDDDTLANAQAMGTQLDEDSEHPQPLKVGDEIDEAEDYYRTH